MRQLYKYLDLMGPGKFNQMYHLEQPQRRGFPLCRRSQRWILFRRQSSQSQPIWRSIIYQIQPLPIFSCFSGFSFLQISSRYSQLLTNSINQALQVMLFTSSLEKNQLTNQFFIVFSGFIWSANCLQLLLFNSQATLTMALLLLITTKLSQILPAQIYSNCSNIDASKDLLLVIQAPSTGKLSLNRSTLLSNRPNCLLISLTVLKRFAIWLQGQLDDSRISARKKRKQRVVSESSRTKISLEKEAIENRVSNRPIWT